MTSDLSATRLSTSEPGRLARKPGSTALAVLRRPATLRILSVAVVLGAWQLVGVSRPYATSYPTAIWRAAWNTTVNTVIPAFGDTMAGFWLGLAICIVVGVPVGLLMAQSKFWQTVLDPYVTIFYSLPFVALFPIFILLVGINFNLRLAVVLLSGLFPIIINTYLGARVVDQKLVDVGQAFTASRFQMVRTVIAPGSVPYILAGIRIGFGRALIAMVIIEIEASAVGVGHVLSQDAQELRIDDYFVPLFYLGFFAIACTYVIRVLDQWWSAPWETPRFLTHLVQPAAALLQRARPEASAVGASDRRNRQKARPAARLSALAIPDSRTASLLRTWQPERFASTTAGRWVIRLVTLLVVLSVWQAYAAHVGTAALPEPTAVAAAMYRQICVSGAIYGPLLDSCAVLALGFLVSLAVGIPLGIVMGRSRLVENVLDPYVGWLYGQPHAAFIPLMIVWFGFGIKFRLVYAVFSAIFIVIINTMAGVKNVDREMLATSRSFCATERQVLRTVVLPSATPFIVAGARLAFAATWIGVVVAEILSTQSGLGGLMTYYSNYYKLADMMVPIIFIMIISVLILWLTSWGQPRLTPWANTNTGRLARP
jgi:NitT/TauT family transport system permease protein